MKKNLKKELEHRLYCIENAIKENDLELLDKFLKYEHSIYSEVLKLINVFGKKLYYNQYEKSRYTPIFCSKTNEPLLIGDKVEDNKGRCGTLQFDYYTKRYVIKESEGGNIHTTFFIKISELYDFKINEGKVECRSPNKYLKPKW